MTEKERLIIENDIHGGFYVGYAYLYPSDGGNRQEYVFDMTPKNIANFLGAHQYDTQKIILTDMLDRKILDTIGGFIDHCPKQEILPEILKTFVPIQTCDAEAEEVPLVSRAAYDEYGRMEDGMLTMAEYGMCMEG